MGPTTRSRTLGIPPVKYETSDPNSSTDSDSDADVDLGAASSDDEEVLHTPRRRGRVQSSVTSSSTSPPKFDRKRKRPVWDESPETDGGHVLDGIHGFGQYQADVKEEARVEESEDEDDEGDEDEHEGESEQYEEEDDEEGWEWNVDLEAFSHTVMRSPSEDEMSDDADEYDQYLAKLASNENASEDRTLACTAYEVFAAEQWSSLCLQHPEANYIQLNVQLNQLWAALDQSAKAHYAQIAASEIRGSEDIDMSEDDDSTPAIPFKVCAPCLAINGEVDRVYDLLAYIRDRAEFNWKIGRRWQSLDEVIQTLELVDQCSLMGGDSEYHDVTACNHLGGAWGCLETGIAEVRMHIVGLKTLRGYGKKRVRPEMVMQLFGRHVW